MMENSDIQAMPEDMIVLLKYFIVRGVPKLMMKLGGEISDPRSLIIIDKQYDKLKL